MQLTFKQLERYSRQLLLDEFGKEGQEKLMSGRVLIIGTGGLGSPVSLYLAGAGVGTIGLMDGDTVDISNLHRQIVHGTSKINVPKVESAAERLTDLNPDVTVVKYHEKFTEFNAESILKDYDVVVDCVDNFTGKFLINDACVMHEKKFVHGGALRFTGQVFSHVPGSPCLRCVIAAPPPRDVVTTCSRAGVLGASVGVIGSLQATEVVKLLTGIGEPLVGRMARVNTLDGRMNVFNFPKNPECRLCGENPTIEELEEQKQYACEADIPLSEFV